MTRRACGAAATLISSAPISQKYSTRYLSPAATAALLHAKVAESTRCARAGRRHRRGRGALLQQAGAQPRRPNRPPLKDPHPAPVNPATNTNAASRGCWSAAASLATSPPRNGPCSVLEELIRDFEGTCATGGSRRRCCGWAARRGAARHVRSGSQPAARDAGLAAAALCRLSAPGARQRRRENGPGAALGAAGAAGGRSSAALRRTRTRRCSTRRRRSCAWGTRGGA